MNGWLCERQCPDVVAMVGDCQLRALLQLDFIFNRGQNRSQVLWRSKATVSYGPSCSWISFPTEGKIDRKFSKEQP